MQLTQTGRQAATELTKQGDLNAIDQAKVSALAAAQTGRFGTVDELSEAVATEEIDAEMYSSLIDSYVAEGLLTTEGGVAPPPSPGGAQASDCSICGSGMWNEGQPGDTDICIKCMRELNKGDISLEHDEFSRQLTGNVEVREGEFLGGGVFDLGLGDFDLKQGEISI